MSEPTPQQSLREIIMATRTEEPPPWSDAAHFGAHTLGAQLGRRIQWIAPSPQSDQLGILAGYDDSVTLRFEEEEPGSAQLQVQVSCPDDRTCPGPAWDIITSAADLLTAIDSGIVDDPWCETCN